MDQQTLERETGLTAPMPSPYDKQLQEAGQLASPTWELELFLSGALVFATFQLPALVERFFSAFEPHVAGVTRSITMNLSLYARAIAYTLLLTFGVHLVGRAQWVALMGLNSVFPDGIRWDALKVGPIARRMYQERTSSLSSTIARLDNFCSTIFSLGMMFVLLFALSAAMVGITGGVAWLTARWFSAGAYFDRYFFAVLGLYVAVPVSGSFLDKKYGAGLSPDSRGYRAIRMLQRIGYAMNVVRVTGPMMWTLMSHVGRRKAIIALQVGVISIIVISAGDALIRRGRLGVNNYDYYGQSSMHGVSSAHYENQRTPDANPREPMIQSDIIRDPYVRLFIPYAPTRHNAALARLCPGLKPLQAEGVQVGQDPPVPDALAVPALQCIAKLHDVRLDGAPIPNLEFAFYEHPGTGLKGVIAYVAVDSLSKGRHVLTAMPAPPDPVPTDSATLATAPWRQPFVIPFWK